MFQCKHVDNISVGFVATVVVYNLKPYVICGLRVDLIIIDE